MGDGKMTHWVKEQGLNLTLVNPKTQLKVKVESQLHKIVL